MDDRGRLWLWAVAFLAGHYSSAFEFGLLRSSGNFLQAQSTKYLYAVGRDANASFPVYEYMDSPTHPKFLHPQTSNISIVHYYVSDCEMCRDLRDHYIKFATAVKSLVQANIRFYAVQCEEHTLLCHDQKVDDFPTFRILGQDWPAGGSSLSHQHLHPYEVVEKLGVQLKTEIDFAIPDVSSSMRVSHPRHVRHRTRGEYKRDLHLALDATLRKMSTDNKELYRYFCRLLHKTLPKEFEEIHAILKDILDNFMYVGNSRDYLLAILDEHERPEKFSQTSLEFDQAYSETMWDLYTSVVLGVYEYNDFSFDEVEQLVPHRIAHLLRDILEEYNTLHPSDDEMAQEFSRQYQRCMESPSCPYYALLNPTDDNGGSIDDPQSEWRELIVWWADMRQTTLNLDFPSRTECTVCWTGTRRYDEMLFWYMAVEYGHHGERTQRYRQELLDESRRRVEAEAARKSTRIYVQHSCIFVLLILSALVRGRCIIGNDKAGGNRRRRLELDVFQSDPHSKRE